MFKKTGEQKSSWFGRIKSGLKKSSSNITTSLSDLVTKRKLDDEMLEEIEEILIGADIGVATAGDLVTALRKDKFKGDVTVAEVSQFLAERIAEKLRPFEADLVARIAQAESEKPFCILVIGVNGGGKTTTIGKLAMRLQQNQGFKTRIAAGDTFRAAAIEQLQVWAERAGVLIYAKAPGSDPASVAFEACTLGAQERDDVVIVDTAGRLQNKSNLMDELRKIVRVMAKCSDEAPQETILVLDATSGQNLQAQVEAFMECVPITGIIMTKLDSTARGGVLVNLVDKYRLPIYAVGVGESLEDMDQFSADAFARGLMGLS